MAKNLTCPDHILSIWSRLFPVGLRTHEQHEYKVVHACFGDANVKCCPDHAALSKKHN